MTVKIENLQGVLKQAEYSWSKADYDFKVMYDHTFWKFAASEVYHFLTLYGNGCTDA